MTHSLSVNDALSQKDENNSRSTRRLKASLYIVLVILVVVGGLTTVGLTLYVKSWVNRAIDTNVDFTCNSDFDTLSSLMQLHNVYVPFISSDAITTDPAQLGRIRFYRQYSKAQKFLFIHRVDSSYLQQYISERSAPFDADSVLGSLDLYQLLNISSRRNLSSAADYYIVSDFLERSNSSSLSALKRKVKRKLFTSSSSKLLGWNLGSHPLFQSAINFAMQFAVGTPPALADYSVTVPYVVGGKKLLMESVALTDKINMSFNALSGSINGALLMEDSRFYVDPRRTPGAVGSNVTMIAISFYDPMTILDLMRTGVSATDRDTRRQLNWYATYQDKRYNIASIGEKDTRLLDQGLRRQLALQGIAWTFECIPSTVMTQPWYSFVTWLTPVGVAALFLSLIVLNLCVMRSERQMYRDSVELFQLLKQVTEAQQFAEEANVSKTAFLAYLCHELRNPLHAIIGNAELLQPLISTDLECEEYIRTIRTSSDLMLAIVNDALDLSKINAGQMSLENIPVDLVHLFHTIFREHRQLTDAKGLRFTLKIHRSVAQYAITDPTRVQQVLVNLISNAIKFTSEGSIIVTIDHEDLPDEDISVDRVSKSLLVNPLRSRSQAKLGNFQSNHDRTPQGSLLRPTTPRSRAVSEASPSKAPRSGQVLPLETPRDARPTMLVLKVADSGIGIPADRLGMLFVPYAQAKQSTHRLYGGTGLGLAIIKGITHSMGGDVRVDSELGQGTAFTAKVRMMFASAEDQDSNNLDEEAKREGAVHMFEHSITLTKNSTAPVQEDALALPNAAHMESGSSRRNSEDSKMMCTKSNLRKPRYYTVGHLADANKLKDALVDDPNYVIFDAQPPKPGKRKRNVSLSRKFVQDQQSRRKRQLESVVKQQRVQQGRNPSFSISSLRRMSSVESSDAISGPSSPTNNTGVLDSPVTELTRLGEGSEQVKHSTTRSSMVETSETHTARTHSKSMHNDGRLSFPPTRHESSDDSNKLLVRSFTIDQLPAGAPAKRPHIRSFAPKPSAKASGSHVSSPTSAAGRLIAMQASHNMMYDNSGARVLAVTSASSIGLIEPHARITDANQPTRPTSQLGHYDHARGNAEHPPRPASQMAILEQRAVLGVTSAYRPATILTHLDHPRSKDIQGGTNTRPPPPQMVQVELPHVPEPPRTESDVPTPEPAPSAPLFFEPPPSSTDNSVTSPHSAQSPTHSITSLQVTVSSRRGTASKRSTVSRQETPALLTVPGQAPAVSPKPSPTSANAQPKSPQNGKRISRSTLSNLEPSKGRLLIVEDEKVNQKLLQKVVTQIGYEADVASNGQEALKKILEEQAPYGLVFMDLNMPVMDGYEAAAALRKQGNQTPIVALSANVLLEERGRCLQLGMNDFLSKPARRAELEAMINKHYRNAESPLPSPR